MKTRILGCALALAAGLASAAWAEDLSTSIMRPTPVDPSTGLVAGHLPGDRGSKSFYLALDLVAGDLITQLQVDGTPNTGKRIDLELLNASARAIDSVYVMAGLDRKGEATKTFPIDRPGRYVVRLTTEGKEAGTYCVLMGGSALPTAKAPGCPAPPAAPAPAPAVVATAPPPPPPPAMPAPPPVVIQATPVVPEAPKPVAKAVEVIVSKCEERLRVGSDFLFDFNRAELRAEADAALAELAHRVIDANKAVLIEGHTDAIGTDAYNQGLSERRAVAVRVALAGRGLPLTSLNVRGYGKSRPVAPNQRPDGSDDPDGRQHNRRVEVVINTCN
jgi:outer membrane protein OmpA-like peptidoglycan-associated protein